MSSTRLHAEALTTYCPTAKIEFHGDKSIKQWDNCSRDTRRSIIKKVVLIAGACTSTAISIIIPTLFKTSSCLGKFPVCRLLLSCCSSNPNSLQACDPKTLKTPSFLPSFLRPAFTCETLLLIICVAVCIHWTCVSLLFQSSRWQERYFPTVLYTAGGATILAAQVVQDPATVFVQVLPLVSDICAVICLSLDCVLS
ncbi:hypothetical protein EDB82DRAFT_503014 [Fusarium venenatum]|uniref:uncharacterized protein n=1 Tax=Fusarium venenatum TaxID=56646 RepID=UPI001DB58FE9|nr:hypothetical protein EDB82DRAFT_503014 [Fusarium venenatum]